MKELDVNPKLFNIIRASDSGAWSKALGKDGDFTIGAPGWGADLKFPATRTWSRRNEAAYNKPPEGVVGAAYAVVQVLADALGRADTFDRDGLRNAIAATKMTTSVIGPISFNPDGTGTVVTIYEQWQKRQAGHCMAARPGRRTDPVPGQSIQPTVEPPCAA